MSHAASSSSTSPPLQFCSSFSKLHSFPSLSLPPKLTFARSFPTLTSSTYKNFSVKCSYSEFLEQQRFDSSEHVSRPAGGGALPPKVFLGHSIYKGKAVMTVNPSPPKFACLESGAYKISREGYVLLQFAPAVSMRQYDWNRKQVFSLSVVEMGNLMCLGTTDSLEFFHDPFKGKSDEGKVRKLLRVEPLADRSGHIFNLSVQDKLMNVDESIYIPVTKSELAVLTSLFNYIIPYLLGWHTFGNSITPDDSSRMNHVNTRSGRDYEWSG